MSAHDTEIVKGDSVDLVFFTKVRSASGEWVPIDLTGSELKFELTWSDTVITKDLTNGLTWDAETGAITVALDEADTKDLPGSTHRSGIHYTLRRYIDGRRTTLTAGSLTVQGVDTPRNTKADLYLLGPQGPKGDSGGGSPAVGDVEPTPNTVVQRDAAGGIKAATVQAQLLYAPAARPAFVQQPIITKRTTPEGKLDGTKTYYFTSLVITTAMQYWTEPELAVQMDGANTVEIQTAAFDVTKIAAVYTFRSEVPGDYTSPGFGVVHANEAGPQAGNAWIFTDIGDPPLQPMQPPAATTVPWQLHQNGFVHTGQVSAGSAVVTDDVPVDANDNRLVPASWVKKAIADAIAAFGQGNPG